MKTQFVFCLIHRWNQSAAGMNGAPAHCPLACWNVVASPSPPPGPRAGT